MTTIEQERIARTVQLNVYARGAGIVELQFEQAGEVIGGTALAYPQQGTMVGAPPRDVQYAAAIREAAKALNAKLAELCS